MGVAWVSSVVRRDAKSDSGGVKSSIASPAGRTVAEIALRSMWQCVARLRAALSAVRIEIPSEDEDTLVPPLIDYPYARN